MRNTGQFGKLSHRSGSIVLLLRGVLVLAIGLTSACGTQANRTFINAEPKTPAQRNHTSFYPALRCMDDLFVQAKRKPVTISANQIPDKTDSISVDARGMIVTALNHMTRRSNAFVFIEQGLLARTSGDTLALERDDRKKPARPFPRIYVNGSISQVDEETRSTQVGVISSDSSDGNNGLSSTTTRPAFSHSIVSLDLHLVRMPSRIVVPGSAISNSMVVSEKGWGAGMGGKISQRTLGLTLEVDRLESNGQAVRNLIELGLIEMLGNYTGVPFWDCLRLPQTNAKKTASEEKSHLRKSYLPGRLFEAQEILSALGYAEVRPTGQMDEVTRKALAHFQAKKGILANGTLDFDTMRALENDRPKPAPLSVKPKPKPTPKRATVRKPSQLGPVKKADDGYRSIQVFVDSAF